MDPSYAVNRHGTRVGQRGAAGRGRFEFDDRIRSVLRAVFAARKYVPKRFEEATGYELKEIASGIVPGLLLMLAVIALSTTVGAAAGAALGALAGGVGAIPGAAAGAAFGFNVSLAILNFLGLAFLAVYIGEALLDGVRVSGEAAEMAWHAIDHPNSEDLVIESAAAHLAYACALVFRGLLQGMVAFLLARGTAAAASRVPELVARLRGSKLGAGFAVWVERNWASLLKNPKLNETPPNSTPASSVGGTSAPNTTEPLPGASTPAKSPKPLSKPGAAMGSNPASSVRNGKISHNDIQELASAKGLKDKWTPSKKFPSGGYKYEWSDGTYKYTAHGHGANPSAPTGSHAAAGPTTSITRQPVGGTLKENLLSDGTWASFKGNENSAHIPLEGSPY